MTPETQQIAEDSIAKIGPRPYHLPTARTLESMKQRCFDPKHHKYHRYGGRGIKICDRWLTYQGFVADMGERPDGTSIDRINNDGNYEPGNCRWATYKTQAQNMSSNRLITFDGRTECVTEWERITGIKRNTLAKRLDSGWPVAAAMTVPVSKSNSVLKLSHENRDL